MEAKIRTRSTIIDRIGTTKEQYRFKVSSI